MAEEVAYTMSQQLPDVQARFQTGGNIFKVRGNAEKIPRGHESVHSSSDPFGDSGSSGGI